MRVEFARHFDLTEREILIDMPVARFVGVGECAPGDVASNAQMIEFGLVSAQTGFDVAKALAARQLREGQAEKLIEMRKLESEVWRKLNRLPKNITFSEIYSMSYYAFKLKSPDSSGHVCMLKVGNSKQCKRESMLGKVAENQKSILPAIHNLHIAALT